jgi:hypothetical protein
MPVVSTRHCDIPECDVDGLTESLDALVCDSGMWPSFGLAGHRHLERRFDVDRLCSELADRYAALNAGR